MDELVWIPTCVLSMDHQRRKTISCTIAKPSKLLVLGIKIIVIAYYIGVLRYVETVAYLTSLQHARLLAQVNK